MKQPPLASRNILVIRLSALGDVVMSSGLIPALRTVHPQARISWLTEPPAAPLLRGNPGLDQVLVWPRGTWQQLWRERRYGDLLKAIMAFRRELRSQRYDLVVDAHGLLKSGLCAWFTGAPHRIGLMPREGSQWLVHERVEPPTAQDLRMGSEYRYLARHLGAADAAFQPDIQPSPQARTAAEQALMNAGVQGPYVVLCPFTTRPQKHWFNDHWHVLAQSLLLKGLTPVMLGGPGDIAASAVIERETPGVVNLAGRLKLDESAALVASCDLLIGVDTGLTHLGSAFKRPTVALFGSTRPYLDGGSARTAILYDALPCSPCRRHPTCNGRFDCMRQLTPARVLQAADTVMTKDERP